MNLMKLSSRLAIAVLVLALVLPAFAQKGCMKGGPANPWEKIDYSKTLLTQDQVKSMDVETLSLVRGIIFGRHGRVFKEMDIQNFLSSRPWYKANPNFSNKMLNDTERQNLDLVRGGEAASHDLLAPGDLRFWEDKKIDPEKVVQDLTSIHIMKAEIEAIHGRAFASEPALQAYFEDRYWYKPDPHYKTSALKETERANLKTLDDLEKKRRGTEIGPGDMLAYSTQPLPDGSLEKLTLYDLRLMRNEFYAIHGYKFKTQWLSDYFSAQDWYQPRDKVVLSDIEKANVAKILQRENQIHQNLSKASLSPDDLSGLFVEDLTKLGNEIYARHGRKFKQKWLQNYFASLPWYKPNPDYSDSLLTNLERENLKTIAAAEKDARSQFDKEEG